LAIAKHDDGFLPVTPKQRYETPAPENLFTVNEDCEKLPEDMAADFHSVIAKTLYVTKRARPDTCLSVAFLTTRVRAPDRDDWEKLRHLIEYLRRDNIRPLVLGADNDGLLMWMWMLMLHLQCTRILQFPYQLIFPFKGNNSVISLEGKYQLIWKL
jgi:hypothetical protein